MSSSSSPLKWFRTHQKWLIVVATAFLMFVFTLSMGSDGIDPLLDMFTGGAASDRRNPIAVSWKGGELRESELTQLRQERTYLRNTLNGVLFMVQDRQGQPMANPIDLNTSDAGILEMVLSTDAAKEYGMQITDDIALEYIRRLAGNGTVKLPEVLTIWKNVTGGRGTENQLLYLLRRELAMQRLQGLVFTAGAATSPLQMWDFYNQLERKMDAELLGFSVENYLGQVEEPTESELRAYFEDYKDDYQEPGRPTPGFKLRERMAFDYIEFNYDAYLDQAKASITDEQVKRFYEENKESFADTSLPSSDLDLGGTEQATPPAEVSSDADVQGDDATDATMPAGDAEDTTTAAATPPTDAATDDDAGENTAERAEPTVETTEDASDDRESSEMSDENAAEETSEDAETDSDGQKGDAEDGDAEDGDAKDGDAKDESPDDGNQGDSDGVVPSLTPVPQADQSQTAAAEAPLNLTLGDEPAKKYKPLEEVAEQIREELAAPLARENIDRAILKAQARMDSYYGKYLAWEQQGKEAGEAPPALPTFEDLAVDGVELKVNSIPLADKYEVVKMDGLGSAVDFRFDGRGIQQTLFIQVAYGNSLRVFQGQSFPGPSSKTRYVYWVTDRAEADVQTFEDARDEVVRAWKMEKARELAFADAEKAAAEAEGKEAALSESLASEGRQFFRTGEITYMTGGSVSLGGGGQARLSEIPGVERAGAPMLRGLFRLTPGEVTVLWNAPQTTVYVAKAMSTSPSLTVREDMFLTGGTSAPGMMSLVRRDRQEMLVGWYEQLQRSKQVKWDREPRMAGQN